jgi:hypothetical protein
MHEGRLVFAQLMDLVPKPAFRRCVGRYHRGRRVRRFSYWDQFLCMVFAQLTFRESLRDIETCLRAVPSRLYHAGIRGNVSRSTLAEANERRDWRIYADFAQVLIAEARSLYADEPLPGNLSQAVYALDATTIDLCLTLFPWAQFRRHKSAVKLHTLIDMQGNIPTFIRISSGKMHDTGVLDELVIEPGAFYLMDRGYIDFGRLHRFEVDKAFFVTRAKKNMDYTRRTSATVTQDARDAGVRSDQIIKLHGPKTATLYPEPLRRIGFYDATNRRRFVFLTNHRSLSALTIAQLYQARWQVELFFKWIKQHLRIKTFFGLSPNAVKTQVWIAVSVYVLAAIVRKRLAPHRSLTEILQVLSLTLFEKTPLFAVFSSNIDANSEGGGHNQLRLFNF